MQWRKPGILIQKKIEYDIRTQDPPPFRRFLWTGDTLPPKWNNFQAFPLTFQSCCT